MNNIISPVVQVGDAISGARPGARWGHAGSVRPGNEPANTRGVCGVAVVCAAHQGFTLAGGTSEIRPYSDL